jgi:hypothetical protein
MVVLKDLMEEGRVEDVNEDWIVKASQALKTSCLIDECKPLR